MNTIETPRSLLEGIWVNLCKYRYEILLIVLLLFSAIIRFSGYNWDGLYTLHPDERSVANAGGNIDFFQFKLDPDFFAYGTLPIYLAKILSSLLAFINPIWNSYNYYILSARLISALAGVISILLVYLIGRKLFTRPVAILSAIFLSLTVSQIQYSHFATVDVLLTFFILMAIYFLIDIYYYKATIKTYITLAVILGLAVAVKISALPLFFVFAVCHIKFSFQRYKELKINNPSLDRGEKRKFLIFSFGMPLLIFCIALMVNFLAQPYAYIKYSDFIKRIHEELDLAKNASTCYTQQYVGTPFLIYYFKELVYRCMGLPLGFLSVVSLLIATFYSFIHPVKSKHIVLLLWVIPYFITINTYEAKFLRYLQPLFPFLCLFSGYYFIKLLHLLKDSTLKRIVGVILLIFVVGYSLFYSLAFFSIYMKPHTFIVGSKWFYKNVPINSFVLSQHWDEGFPMNIDHENKQEFQKEDLELYEHFGSATEGSVKSEYLAKFLEKGDYIVLQTRRLYGGIGQVKDRYPITYRYFDLLFTNRLGFKLIKEFTSYPSLLGINFNDDLADESFSVYDHPKILIYKKIKHLDKKEYKQLLEKNEEPTLTKEDMLTIRLKDDNNNEFNPTIVDEILLAGIWIVIFQLLAIIGIFITHYITKKGDASNFFYYHIAGLLAFSVVMFPVGFLNYSFISVMLTFLFLLLFATAYIYKNKEDIIKLFKSNLATLIFSQSLFIGFIFLILLIRAYVPEIYSGEKPMDFGFLNNLVIVDNLPAKEIWFGGKDLQYYYFGYFIFANIIKISFIPTYISYNLSVATVGGLTILASSGILYKLTNSWRWAFLGGVSTSIIGNLSGLRELLWNKNPLNYDFYWATSRVIPHTINEYPLWSVLFGDLHSQFIAMPIFITILYFALCIFLSLTQEGQFSIKTSVFTGILVGIISQTNSWDLPSVLLIILSVIILASILNLNVFKGVNIKKNLISLLAFIFSCLILLPWGLLLNNKTQSIGKGFISPEEMVINSDYVTIWGLFLFIFAVMFTLDIIFYIKSILDESKSYYKPLIYLIPILIALIIYICYLYSSVTFMIALLIFSIIALYLTNKNKTRFIYLLIIIGLSLNIFASTFYINDHMNTVFKYFLESWYLFAIASAFGIYHIFKIRYPDFGHEIKYFAIYKKVFAIIIAALGFLAILTTISSTFAFTQTDRVYSATPTLNGEKYLQYQRPNEFLAIKWIRKNIDHNSVILEATGKGYSEATRIVMNTGIPTVLGWKYHLSQRAVPTDLSDKTEKDIENIYSNKDASIAYDLLKKHKVNYVYIGWLEAQSYNRGGFAKFELNKDKFLLVYSNPDVKIYKVF